MQYEITILLLQLISVNVLTLENTHEITICQGIPQVFLIIKKDQTKVNGAKRHSFYTAYDGIYHI